MALFQCGATSGSAMLSGGNPATVAFSATVAGVWAGHGTERRWRVPLAVYLLTAVVHQKNVL